MSDFTFLNVLDDSLDYNMTHEKAGKCLIYNHFDFKDPDLKQRKGTQEDVNRITAFFKGQLGFEIEIYNDLTKKQIIENTQTMANQDFTQYNCFVCCILSHGHETTLEAYDGPYHLDSLISFFRAERCPSLAGKPKLFFIQACQGRQMDQGHNIRLLSNQKGNYSNADSLARDVVDGENNLSVVTVKIPVCADILVAYASVPKHYSFRDTLTGSWFFEVLMQVFEQHYKEHDLVTILTITKRRIAFEKISNSTDPNVNNKKQIPWITDTLTRRVFFKKYETQNQTTNYLCCSY